MKKYLIFAVVLFSLFVVNTKALEGYDDLPAYLSFNYSGYINNVHTYEQDNYDDMTKFSNFTTISAGNEISLKIYYNRYAQETRNYLLQVSVCTTSSAFAGASTAMIDFSGAELIKSYSTNSMPLNNCYVGGYTGQMYILNYAVTVTSNVSSFSQIIWSGTHDNYNQFARILIVNAVEYTTELATQLDANEKASTTINQNNTIINQNNSLLNKQDQTNSKLDDLGGKQDQTNSKLDDLKDMDIDSDAKEKPDDSDYKDYEKSQGDLTDKIDDVPMDNLDIGIDAESSNFIFESMYKFINAHPAVFSMFIAILSIGIIKLGLGR